MAPLPAPPARAGGSTGGTDAAAPTNPPDGGSGEIQASSVAAPFEPQALVSSVITQVARGVQSAVKPEAATAVAQTFGFPLALMLAVLGFLIIQGRMDDRDPKLRGAPLTAAETTILFVNEADLR